MLSPVVVAVIWDWILKRRGIFNALLSDGVDAWNAMLSSHWRVFVAIVAAVLLAPVLASGLSSFGRCRARSFA